MKCSLRSFAVACAAIAMFQSGAQAGTIAASGSLNGLSSYTTPDSQVTLTPYTLGGAAGTIGATGCCIGVAGGTNQNGVDDADGDPSTTGDRETLDIELAATTSILDISFNWTRADGPLVSDGIAISGFLSNPGASVDAAAAGDGVTTNYNPFTGTLYIKHPWRAGAISTISFANLNPSQGQTLSVEANDSDQTAPQAVIRGISYVIPEPSTLMLAGVAALFTMRRKK